MLDLGTSVYLGLSLILTLFGLESRERYKLQQLANERYKLEQRTPERDKAFRVAVRENKDLPTLTEGGENISQDIRNKALAWAIENNVDPERVEKLAKIAELKKAIHRKRDGIQPGKKSWFGKAEEDKEIQLTPLERAENAGNKKAEEILREIEQQQEQQS